jgi:hypothetical protein
MATPGTDALDTASSQALLGPQRTAEQAVLIFHQRQEAVVFTRLTLAAQLAERQVARHASERFTYLDHRQVPPDNNDGERPVRLAVIARQNSNAYGSEDGAETQAILMSIFRMIPSGKSSPLLSSRTAPPDTDASFGSTWQQVSLARCQGDRREMRWKNTSLEDGAAREGGTPSRCG